MLARARRAVVMVLRRLRWNERTRRCISYGAAIRGVASNAAGEGDDLGKGCATTSNRSAWHIVCFAKSAPRFHPIALVSSIASPICLQGFGLLDPLRKSDFGSPANELRRRSRIR